MRVRLFNVPHVNLLLGKSYLYNNFDVQQVFILFSKKKVFIYFVDTILFLISFFLSLSQINIDKVINFYTLPIFKCLSYIFL
jgi:hypothetical protein